jgi:RimJ/RimL family protein N-acetyltransferase
MLDGNKVVLRPFEKDDLEKNLNWINNLNFQELFLTYLPITKTEEYKWYEEAVQSKTKIILSINIKDTGEYIGNIGYSDIDYKNRKATIWIYIGEQQQRRNGYGQESFNIMLDYGVNFLNLRKISLNVAKYNSSAISLYEGSGFLVEGVFKDDIFIKGKYIDVIRMAKIYI